MNLVFHYCYLQSLAGAGFLFPANQSSQGVSGTMSCQQKYIGVCVYVQAYEGHWFISLFTVMCFTL